MKEPTTYVKVSDDSLSDAKDILGFFNGSLRWDVNEKILDIGCGPGNVTSALQSSLPAGCTIIGSDISEEAIQYANLTYRNDSMLFKVMDILDPNLLEKWEENTFSKIMSFYCLHRIENQSLAFKHIYSLLKPGGQILLLIPARSAMFEMCDRIINIPKYKPYFKDQTNIVPFYYLLENPVQELKKLLVSIGFNEIQCLLKESMFTYPSLQSYIELFKVVNPFVTRMPDEVQEQLLKDCSAIIMEQNLLDIAEGGAVTSHYELVFALASKPK